MKGNDHNPSRLQITRNRLSPDDLGVEHLISSERIFLKVF